MKLRLLSHKNDMATHNYILTDGRQTKICQSGKIFLERNLFITVNLISLFQFFDEERNKTSLIRGMAVLAERLGFAVLFKNCFLRFFDERRKVCADAVSNAKRQFQCWIAKSPLDETQHGFGNARTLRDRIIGKFPAMALLLQETDNFIANGFVVADTRHAGVWQEGRFDIYFAIVKNRAWRNQALLNQN